MMITKIVLSNIKSYVYEEIDFSEGINCILGLNGSGKSTIIESIGLALFNFNKVTLNQMLRYNESKGYIEVEFIANDERKYKVVKTLRLKGSSSVKIIDMLTGTELYDNSSDVYAFIKKILKIKKTKEFTRMFEEIIAVPQGQYVSAFLEKSSVRKENFDRLFDLHVYKETANKVKDIVDNFKNNQVQRLKSEIDDINGQVKNLDEKDQALANINKELADLEKEKVSLKEKLELVKEQKAHLEFAKSELEKLQTNLMLENAKYDNMMGLVEQTKKALDEANAANDIVKNNLANYLRYQDNIAIISDLDKLYQTYLENEKALKTVENNLQLLDNDLVNLQEKDSEKAQEYEQKLKQQKVLNTQMFAKQMEYERLNKIYLNNTRKQEEKVKQLNDKIKVAKETLQDLTSYLYRYQEINIYDEATYNNNVTLIQEKREELNKIKEEQNKIIKLEKEYEVTNREYEINKQNSRLTIDGTCPFLKTKCMNIGGKSLTSYFKEKENECAKKMQALQNEIDEIKAALKDEKTVTNALQSYEQYQQAYISSLSRIEKLESEFKEKYQVNLTIDAINNLTKDYEQKLNDYNQEIQAQEANKKQLVNDYIEINTIKMRIKTDEENLKTIDKDILSILKLRSEIKDKITSKNTLKRKLQIEHTNLSEALKQHYDIKEKLDATKAENEKLQASRDQYLANVTKAKETTKLELTLKDLNTDITNLNQKVSKLKEEITSLSKGFSLDLLVEVGEVYNQTLQDIKAVETSIIERTKVKVSLIEEINHMHELIDIRNEKQNELAKVNKIIDFLNNMRTIYSNLPLKLSATYREYIASMATSLYRQIANENVHIDILEDYEVRIVDDQIKENYKSMEQLSGGEQMSVALAIRLSMLKHLTGLDIYFLDEPTINLDVERRERIGEVIQDISQELTQLFVISHDDTFDSITDRVIKLEKIDNKSHNI